MSEHNLKKLYLSNAIDGFSNGARLDLRLRTAVQLLTSPAMGALLEEVNAHANARDDGEHFQSAAGIAGIALEIAEALIEQAEAKGYVLPFTAALGEDLEAHAKRMVAWQMAQQHEGQRVAAEAAGVIARPQPGPKMN